MLKYIKSLFSKHGAALGMLINLLGSILLAISLDIKKWKELSGGCSISCGRNDLTVAVLTPWLFYLGIGFLIVGFIVQIIHNYLKK